MWDKLIQRACYIVSGSPLLCVCAPISKHEVVFGAANLILYFQQVCIHRDACSVVARTKLVIRTRVAGLLHVNISA